jgi:hypothetical protein
MRWKKWTVFLERFEDFNRFSEHPFVTFGFVLAFCVNQVKAVIITTNVIRPRAAFTGTVFEFVNGIEQMLALSAFLPLKVQICCHVNQFVDAKLFSCTDQLEQVLDEQRMRVVEAVWVIRENQRKAHGLITLAL